MKLGARLIAIATLATYGYGYSVLTHQAVTDTLWDSHIRPLLLLKYPSATEEQLRKAHANVYGGSLIQDLGYVPVAPRAFSDLTHYVCSGDFVLELLRQAETVEEYGFALGTLAHYTADKMGHPMINRITPLLYPKTKAKYGDVVTYEDAPIAHLKTEFALDVLQAARGFYAPDAYHSYVGFEVARPVLKRAFEATYGFPMGDLFLSEDIAIGTYRFSISRLIPTMTNAAWELKKKEIAKRNPQITRRQFTYVLPRKKFEKEWGKDYTTPNRCARTIAFFFKFIPAVGPFKVLSYPKIPAEAEEMFMAGLESTVSEYRRLLDQEKAGTLKLEDDNLDTGEPIKPNTYRMADKAFTSLIDRLVKNRVEGISPALRQSLIQYYGEMRMAKKDKRAAPAEAGSAMLH